MKTLAIELSGSVIKLVLVDDGSKIEFLDTINSDFNFNEDIKEHKNNEVLISGIADQINTLIREYNIKPDRTSLVLDSSQVFLTVVPVDYTEDSTELKSHILWELSNYFPDNYKNYKITIHRLPAEDLPGNVEYILIIAIENDRLGFVKKIFDLCGLKIDNSDIDLFSAEKFIAGSPETGLQDSKYFLLGCKAGRIDIGVVKYKNFVYYESLRYKPGAYKESINRILKALRSLQVRYGINKFCLFGEDFVYDLAGAISSKIELAQTFIPDPFRTLTPKGDMKNYSEVKLDGNKFVSACGIAMKGR